MNKPLAHINPSLVFLAGIFGRIVRAADGPGIRKPPTVVANRGQIRADGIIQIRRNPLRYFMKALLNALASECYCDAMLELLAKHRDRHMRYAWVTDWRTSYEFQRVLCADVDDEVAFEASEKVAQYDWDGGTWNNVDE